MMAVYNEISINYSNNHRLKEDMVCIGVTPGALTMFFKVGEGGYKTLQDTAQFNP